MDRTRSVGLEYIIQERKFNIRVGTWSDWEDFAYVETLKTARQLRADYQAGTTRHEYRILKSNVTAINP